MARQPKTKSVSNVDADRTIKIFTVGGTIDKIYFDAKSRYEVGRPVVGDILEEAGVALQFEVESLMRKDSLSMTDGDRKKIAAKLAAEARRRILITHGTDTMIQTAKALQSIPDKVIVLTGAIEPAIFKASDAAFNVGCAVAALQILPPGVYIAMNGRIFDPDKVHKNIGLNRFEDA